MNILTELFSSVISLVFDAEILGIKLALWLLTPVLLSVILKLITGRK